MVVTRLWDLSRGWAHQGRPALLAVSVFLLVAGSAVAQDGAASDGRWRDVGDGVLLDSETGLEWTQRDNGSDVDWQAAMSYCGGLGDAGGGWRLPSLDEFEGLVRTGLTGFGFVLTGYYFWSSTMAEEKYSRSGSSEAWVLHRSGSARRPPLSHQSIVYPGGRALCVRRSGG